MKSYIAIDTSITACGIAVYEAPLDKLSFGTLRPEKEGTIMYRSGCLWDKVWDFIQHSRGKFEVLIEMPTFQESQKGVIAAVQGGLTKLAYTAGFLSAKFYTVSSVETVRLVTPPQWKGMISKDITRERILRHPILGPKLKGFHFDHNASDAIGMIAWAMDTKPKLDLNKAMIVDL